MVSSQPGPEWSTRGLTKEGWFAGVTVKLKLYPAAAKGKPALPLLTREGL